MSGLRFACVTSDENGRSHFSDVELEGLTEWDAHLARLVRVPAGHASERQPEPEPTLATVISGTVTIGTSDGATRTLTQGTTMLFADTRGEGHSFQNGPSEAVLLVVRLAHSNPRAARTAHQRPADEVAPS